MTAPGRRRRGGLRPVGGGPGTGRRGRTGARPGRDEGLTTLEWLLVVAAVAGVAAVAVVLMGDTVGGAAERVRSSEARQRAADLAVTTLAERWQQETPASGADADEINRRYRNRCLQVGIIYSGITLTAEAYEGTYTGGSGWGPLDKHKPSCHIR